MDALEHMGKVWRLTPTIGCKSFRLSHIYRESGTLIPHMTSIFAYPGWPYPPPWLYQTRETKVYFDSTID